MPKVQCGVSVPPLPVKVSPKVTQSDETWQTCLARWATHAKSAMWRLSATASGESVAEGDPERRNLADLFGPMGHACQKCNVASQCHRFRSLKSRLSLGTCLARWATHAKSAMWRLSATASGESVAEGTLTGPSLKSRLSLGVGDPERRNLADLFGSMGHACQKCNVASQCHRFR
ncbi:hypothetical protein DPMN_087977 [Dreissena polymorpha]|uniref:Uncharacterized protein n=1 Tax=Dreissena polymorpha TaxID=45954 RepID=A0A9D4KU02_DREPO|nr:hypothetical protein DPMN_087977 [Dreissena polymorpha]